MTWSILRPDLTPDRGTPPAAPKARASIERVYPGHLKVQGNERVALSGCLLGWLEVIEQNLTPEPGCTPCQQGKAENDNPIPDFCRPAGRRASSCQKCPGAKPDLPRSKSYHPQASIASFVVFRCQCDCRLEHPANACRSRYPAWMRKIEGKSNQKRRFTLKQLVWESWEEYKVIQVGETRVYSSKFARGFSESPPLAKSFPVIIIIPCDSTERLTRMLSCRDGSVWSNLPCSERGSVMRFRTAMYFRDACCPPEYCADRLWRRDRCEGGQAHRRCDAIPADPAERAQRGREEGNWPG